MTTTPATPVPNDSCRPWAKRADELFEREGMYADYAAWREWIANAISKDHDDILDVLDEASPSAYAIALYSIMCDLSDAPHAALLAAIREAEEFLSRGLNRTIYHMEDSEKLPALLAKLRAIGGIAT